MSADKRTVSTDALETLGTILTKDEKRDAIHLAVIPVEAGCTLHKGADVGIGTDGKAYDGGDVEKLGIVDPFIRGGVNRGERFWLVIYPRVITSLRHVWTHPALPDEPGVSATYLAAVEEVKALEKRDEYIASNRWLQNWCSHSEISYDDLLEVAKSGEATADEEYGHRWKMCGWGGDGVLMSYGSDAYGEIPSEVWDHVKVVIGQEPVLRPDHFGCSC